MPRQQTWLGYRIRLRPREVLLLIAAHGQQRDGFSDVTESHWLLQPHHVREDCRVRLDAPRVIFRPRNCARN